jgi:hypothetical protein
MRVLTFLAIFFVVFEEIFSQNCGRAQGGVGNVIGGSKIAPHQYPW